MGAMLRVAACQTPEILGDVEASLACMERFAERATGEGVDLLLFSECFLQGYLVDEEYLRRHGFGLRSAQMRSVLQRLAHIRPAVVFGLTEEDDGRYFNSAVVVQHGEILGVYRKNYLVPGEAAFSKGDSYPVFVMNGVTFGINICYDTQFAAAAAAVAAQGAQVLLVSAQNMIRRENAEHWKERHHGIRAERAKETGMWLVSSDVTGERGTSHIGYGPTSVLSPAGEVVAQVPLMTTGMVIADFQQGTQATTGYVSMV